MSQLPASEGYAPYLNLSVELEPPQDLQPLAMPNAEFTKGPNSRQFCEI